MPPARITPNDHRLLQLASEGRTNKEIAVEFSTSEQRIKNLMTRLFDAMGARNRAHAVAMAVKKEIIK
jgi:two-component system nitrate/nitrite response regulator NarL